jgi:signal transduction histidine kinase/ActR/RegA family two-component response regulator
MATPEPGSGISTVAQELSELKSINAALLAENAALRVAALEARTLRDTIEHMREANQNLVVAAIGAQSLRDDAEATNLRQNEFLAMLAHELRNPLAPISMAATMLARMPAPGGEVLNLQAVIERQVKHLSRLLDDLLDAARISSGKIALQLEVLSLQDLLERSLQTVKVRLDERGQQLECHFAGEPLLVNGDATRLEQVFANVLVNAAKFTPDGGHIVLMASREGDTAVVTVADDGMGISAEVLPHIFALFTQGPRSLARAEAGLGVGLNVVRNVVELHGGTVDAASRGLGLGSAFTVKLPLSHQPVNAPPTMAHAGFIKRLRILLVEDNRDASDTLALLLRHEGHDVVAAYDGVTGLARARVNDFDVLICDIGLPGMDGLQLIRALRGTIGIHIPFAVAVSGYGQEEDRVRALSAGFAQYLVKPIPVDTLLDLLGSPAVVALVASSRQYRKR